MSIDIWHLPVPLLPLLHPESGGECCSSVDIRATSAVTTCDWPTPSVVVSEAEATPTMLRAISVAPVAASAMLRPISWVVAVCCSTAAAIVVRNWSIRAMTCEISVIAVTALPMSFGIATMRCPISSVAFAVAWPGP
jgi:hypothetical protein